MVCYLDVATQLDTDFLHGYTDFGRLNPCIRVQIRVELGRDPHPLSSYILIKR